MFFVTGPLYSGKKTFVMEWMGWDQEALSQNAIWDVQDLASDCEDLERLAEELSRKQVVIAVEVGGGIVPASAQEREAREAAGRLACLLAKKADAVIRVFCGIPTVLKGEISL
jgi:adenosylcobinamide kinase/adenosylcobinamide-phosphate guanylyltransferase